MRPGAEHVAPGRSRLATVSLEETMPKQRTHARLSKRDIELIVGVVYRAGREGWTVAEVVRHRLRQNETALRMCMEEDADEQHAAPQEARDLTYRLIASETRRILRLQRRFASWRSAEFAAPCSQTRDPGPASRPHSRGMKHDE
jgi:hypothetical protein